MAIFTGSNGNDNHVGTAGVDDTAVFATTLGAASFNFDGQAWRVTSPVGTDTLTSIEAAQFSDGTVQLSAGGGAARINTTTASDQFGPHIGVRADGSQVITWSSNLQDGSGYGVYQQRFAASGAALGGETRVNTTTINDQVGAVVAMLGGGGHVVAWQSLDSDGTGNNIYLQRFDASGAPAGPETRVNLTTAGTQQRPMVAALQDGGHVVVWESTHEGSGYGLYLQRYAASGAAVGTEVHVNTAVSSDQSLADLAVLAGGSLVVTWQSFGQDGAGWGIYQQRYASNGAVLGGETRVNTNTIASEAAPSIAALAGGGYVIAWDSAAVGATTSGIHLQRFASNGAAVGAEQRIDTSPGIKTGTSVAALSGGGLVVVWHGEDGSGFGVYAQRLDAAGQALGAETRISVPTFDNQWQATVKPLADGGYVITWQSGGEDGSGSGIYAQRFDAAGQSTLASLTGDAGGNLLRVVDARGYSLAGLAGDDDLRGGAGADRLDGGDGHDTLTGGTGNDTLVGGNGSDRYGVDAAGDLVVETGSTAGDIDTVQASIPYTLAPGLENLVLTGASGLQGTGNAGDNLITGNAGGNLLDGGAGNDTLDGGSGSDTLQGGAGRDTYLVDSTLDLVLETGTAAGEIDTVLSAVGYLLGDRLEALVLGGNSAIWGSGNDADNALTGNAFNNQLDGRGGNDTLDGGGGNDTLTGEAGSDTYVIDSAGDRIIENGLGAGEIDTVRSAISHVLDSTLEALVLTGSLAINGTGNAGANTLSGNAANNLLDGGGGADTLTGGDGSDTYRVDSVADRVVELAGAVGDVDTVQASVSYTLAANVEALVLTGTEALDGTGNGAANALTGNAAANRLDGGAGADTLTGGAGGDTYRVDSAADQVVETGSDLGATDTVESSVNWALGETLEALVLLGTAALNGSGNALANAITGNAGANRLDGGGGADTLDGGAGADTLAGGAGGDTYLVDSLGDGVQDDGTDTGIDHVLSSVSFALDERIERLTLTGLAAINGTGNAGNNLLAGNDAANRLTGADGADTLDGGGGNDTLVGGEGGDTYRVDSAGDVLQETGSGLGEVDTVQSLVSYALSDAIENLGLIGPGRIDGTGNAGANRLTGNAEANVLNGAGGADTLAGGAGDDSYVVDDPGDQVLEAAGAEGGIDTVIAFVTTTLAADVEHLQLAGADAIDGTGNALDNALTGNDSPNRLDGAAGNDTLDGAEGADTLVGGSGDDTFVIDAPDTVVELSGGGTDTVVTTESYTLASNFLENAQLAGSLAASLVGNRGANQLTGNEADNLLNGGLGADTLAGGAGSDTYVVDSLADSVIEGENQGVDTVLSDVNHSLGEHLENLRLVGRVAVFATGNGLDNLITGNAIGNSLTGGDGADTLVGGGGNDQYLVDASDLVLESPDDGIDTVFSSVTWVLGAHLERLALLGDGAVSATGNGLDNQLTGNAGDNRLDGGAGADDMDGRDGSDTYLVDHLDDQANDSGAVGTDLVRSSVSHFLGLGIEQLTLTGSTALHGRGNGLNNLIIGNAVANLLSGELGADTLIGGAGDDDLSSSDGLDQLEGGLGDDTYRVVGEGDLVIEHDGGGRDSVVANVTAGYTLAAQLENLLLAGGDVDGFGNALSNFIVGTDGANLLDGGAGADALWGGLGNDTYLVDHAADRANELAGEGEDQVFAAVGWVLSADIEHLTLTGLAAISGTGNALGNRLFGNAANNGLAGLDGHDLLAGGGGHDHLQGGAGDDTLDGGAGNDTQDGGTGVDTLSYFSTASAVVVDLALAVAQATQGAGTDLVLNIENLQGSNRGADLLRGQAGANLIDGAGGHDTLAGGAGDDTLLGGDGFDLLSGDAGDDRLEGGPGLDTASYADIAGHLRIDLNQEAPQALGAAGTDWLVDIENLTGSATGNDTLLGNRADNLLAGGGGNDWLTGGAGVDTLDGGAGTDTADYATAASAVHADLSAERAFIDGDGHADRLLGVENLRGSVFADRLAGNAAANLLEGGLGNDVLNGSVGADTMVGGLGDDIYYVDGNSDLLVELAGGGTDEVRLFASHVMAAQFENLRIVASGAVSATGNSLDNLMLAGAGDNTLDGAAGSDTASYTTATAAVQLSLLIAGAQATGGSGSDALIDIENLVGTVFGDRLTGSAQANALSGGLGNDTLVGDAGNDTLIGGAGADSMAGGSGDDVYHFDHIGDAIVEAVGGGIDEVRAWGSHVMAANVENLRIMSSASVAAFGNGLDNVLHAGGGDNTLNGGGGSDTASYAGATGAVRVDLADASPQATGGSGTDILAQVENLVGSAYNDSLSGTFFNNQLDGGGGSDTLLGGAGHDTLNGGTGADSMVGGLGDDVYTFDNGGDAIVEAVGGGIDEVRILGSHVMAANVENLRIDSSGVVAAFGNGLDNSLLGGAGANTLNGGAGNDTLRGAAGADTLTGGAGSDVFMIDSLVGSDLITDFTRGLDQLHIAQGSLAVGNGDTVIDGLATVAGPGGFASTAELVVVTGNIAGAISAASAAAAIGSAASAYAAGRQALFVVDNGVDAALFLFGAGNANAQVEAAELTLLAGLGNLPGLGAGDLVFGA